MKEYDVIIIGGGIGGMMCAYRLAQDSKMSILLIEKGKELAKRSCPIVNKKVNKCIKCNPCAIMEGMAGAGAFSDGKYIISTEYGGWLQDIYEPEVVLKYIHEADDILVEYGACKDIFVPDDTLKLTCLKHDLHMQQAQVKHLGTDANFNTMLKIQEVLMDKIDIITECEAYDILKDGKIVKCKKADEDLTFKADKIVFAPGRAGSKFFKKWCEDNNIELKNNQVDIGVRVELPWTIWKHFSEKIYEPKIKYYTKKYHDVVRMFCFNERGHVVTENTHGVLTVNGHSFKDEKFKTQNSNFALLSTSNFTEPFNEPIEYARSIASLANQISGGSVLVQRLGDLKNGKRTDSKRLKESSVRPTLDAIPGDLSLCLPKRQLDNIIETLDALSEVAPGTNNYDTLLYGVECKYYSSRPKSTNFELDGYAGIYALGDGAGFTRSLSQAAASGLMVADNILKVK